MPSVKVSGLIDPKMEAPFLGASVQLKTAFDGVVPKNDLCVFRDNGVLYLGRLIVPDLERGEFFFQAINGRKRRSVNPRDVMIYGLVRKITIEPKDLTIS